MELKYPQIAVGNVVKVAGAYRKETGPYHNFWAVVVAIRPLDQPIMLAQVHDRDGIGWPAVAEVDVVVRWGPGVKLVTIYDQEVKWPIGSLTEDFVGIGSIRHEAAVKPFILEVMEGGYGRPKMPAV